MNRRHMVLGMIGMAIAPLRAAFADRLPTVGVLWFADEVGARPFADGFAEGLRQLGYVDGRNIAVVTRHANGNAQRLAPLIAELVALGVDVLFVSSRALRDAKNGAGRLPVVCAGFSDPVAEGFAKTMARPGGNFTGLSWQTSETIVKRLELAREILPSLQQAGILYTSTDAQTVIEMESFRSAAKRAGLRTNAFELEPAPRDAASLQTIANARPQALFTSDFPLAIQHRVAICRLATAQRIPLFAESAVFAEAGALLSFGADGVDMFRRGAGHVDKILRGARPGDLPIEQPTKFVLTLNLRTAREIGAEIPRAVLLRTDKTIE